MFTHRPAMKFCLPFIIGIIIGWKWSFPLLIVGITVILLYILALVTFLKYRNTIYCTLAAFMLLMFFGILKISYDGKHIARENISNYITLNKNVLLEGTVSDLPRVTSQSIRFVIDAEVVTITEHKFESSGGVLISILKTVFDSTLVDSLKYGRKVHLIGELATINTARNPGEFDLQNYLHLNNIYARFYPVKFDSTNLGDEVKGNLLSLFVYPVRRSVADRIDKYIGGEEGKFLKGLIIGERSEISVEVKTAFINSGVMHIIAVSGLHVAIVTLMLVVLLQLVRIPEKSRIIITSFLLVYYIFLTGAAPSVIRSVIMAIVFLCAKLLERKSDMYNTLAISAMILLLFDSKQLFQPGFQLSFVAVFSLVYLYPQIYGLKYFLPKAFSENKFVIAIFAGVAVSVAAGVGTLPFTSVYFGKISFISFVANVIIVPLSNIILALGMVTVAVSYFSSWVTSVYAVATSFLTWLLLKLVNIFGNIPLAYIDSRFSTLSSIMFYAGIGVVINLGRRELRNRLIIVSLIILNFWTYGFLIYGQSSNSLLVTFLDVGQGDAIFLEFPDGKNMLVDGGPRTFNTDAGARFIFPFLKYKGISRINTILVTHSDADHLGGVPTLLRQIRVDQVIETGSNCKSYLCGEYQHLIDSLKIQKLFYKGGMTIGGSENSRVYVVHPSGGFVEEIRTKLNNQSLIMKVVYGKTSLLFTGDAEEEAERWLVKGYGAFLKSDILKVAHHGSISGTSSVLINSVRPEIAIISVGAKNKFQHPSPVVLRRLGESGAKYFRTDESGAIMMESDGTSWSQVEWR